jgi:hypothetical protein
MPLVNYLPCFSVVKFFGVNVICKVVSVALFESVVISVAILFGKSGYVADSGAAIKSVDYYPSALYNVGNSCLI